MHGDLRYRRRYAGGCRPPTRMVGRCRASRASAGTAPRTPASSPQTTPPGSARKFDTHSVTPTTQIRGLKRRFSRKQESAFLHLDGETPIISVRVQALHCPYCQGRPLGARAATSSPARRADEAGRSAIDGVPTEDRLRMRESPGTPSRTRQPAQARHLLRGGANALLVFRGLP